MPLQCHFSLLSHFVFGFFFFFKSSVCTFFFPFIYIYIYIYIYSYTDATNFTIFSQLLRCQFFISQNKIIKYETVTNHN